MDVFRVQAAGPLSAPLQGRVEVGGAKNSALKLMAATLLASGESTITNVPQILDVTYMGDLLDHLGCRVAIEDDRAVIDVPERIGHEAPYELVRRLRASIAVLGPLVARCGRASVAMPGGDAIGSRGLDMHLAGLEALGAQVRMEHGQVIAEAPGGLRATQIELPFPSVGATENLVTASVLARGTTEIDNVAREPEIIDLCQMLVSMGARIDGIGSPTLTVEGVDELHPVEHATVGDRIVGGTWAFAAAIAGGEVEVVGVDAAHLPIVLDKLSDCGVEVVTTETGLVATMQRRPRAFEVQTLPFPGFPTDLQPFAMALAAVADGVSMITENVFEARFMFLQELARLGADAKLDGHHAAVRGRPLLSGAPVVAHDIRAGAALVLAGLASEGVTLVSGGHHIDRGYPHFEASLRQLGADVTRVA